MRRVADGLGGVPKYSYHHPNGSAEAATARVREYQVMTLHAVPAGYEPFLRAADEAAVTRPGVDPGLARELMAEAATMLHNGLVVDHLDAHDQQIVIAGLAAALTDPDPSDAILRAVDDLGTELHDPEGASGAYLTAAAVLRL